MSLLGLAALGLGCAPVYPSMVAITAARLGERHAANAMGFQVAAATLGLALTPSLIGIAADRWGVRVIAWGILAATLLVKGCLFALLRHPPMASLRESP